MKVAGTVALVTGGGGMLGAATVERLVEQGARVLVADLAPGRCEPLLTSHPEQVAFVATDVTDERSVAGALDRASSMGPLRVVVNCAGAGIVQRTLAKDGTTHDVAAFRQMLDLNVMGTFMVLVRAAAIMSRLNPVGDDERGVIINTSSLAGLEGSAGQVAYGTAKAAVAGMTLPAARDLGPAGIRVVAIAPGGMGEPGAHLAPTEKQVRLLAEIPRQRFGTPQEFALLVTQLVENPYLNGAVFRLDGGARLGLKF